MAKIGLLSALFVMSSCEKTEEERVCDMVSEFAEAYYNWDIERAKIHCESELVPIMNFRQGNFTELDWAYRKAIGKSRVQILDCKMLDNGTVHVIIEVSNLVCIDYIANAPIVIPRDTVQLIVVRTVNKDWCIRYIK